jgi:hypothetical protein
MPRSSQAWSATLPPSGIEISEERADRSTRVRQDGASWSPQKLDHQGTISAGKTRFHDAGRLPHVRRRVLRTGLNASPGVEAVPGQVYFFAHVHAVGQIQLPI